MGKREQAQEEARFMRGDVGVDGQATEEQQDASEAERDKAREQFLRGKAYLGREFLTWLLWRSESGDPIIDFDGLPLTVMLMSKVVLRGIAGDVVETVMKGAMAPYSPLVRKSLDRGLLIHATRLKLTHGEHIYEVSIDAEHLDLRSAKLPELLSEEENDIRERLSFAERLSDLVQALLDEFLKLRQGNRWTKTIVPQMKEWMAEPLRDEKPALKKAAG